MDIPQPFKDRYCAMVDEPDAFLACLNTYLPKSFRVNSLKATAAGVREKFEGYGFSLKQMPWYEDAFVCDSLDINSTIEHFSGRIYMQELVSMLPPLMLREELSRARVVLDACAAPGSKTTEMAALMGNLGTIVANDVAYPRIKALKFNIEKTGTLNTVITNRDLRNFPRVQFDTVLLDAPCSSEGTMRKNGEMFQEWSLRAVLSNASQQRQLVLKAFELLAPGGSMVYSTCTFAPEENEMIVQHLLDHNPGAQIAPFAFEGLKTSRPLDEWQGRVFDERIRNAIRVWPHHNDTGGFFLAKVVK
ncbi:MAG TPA: RsmB/NOP family class I SAM-dependent RNA methyltransferase [Candidatus Bilamarchaeum sp.]|nr:RsmB/NOP family class I SAM-dependent RNA methyltransferase [Candidatus Bilamarchaeum sp.]